LRDSRPGGIEGEYVDSMLTKKRDYLIDDFPSAKMLQGFMTLDEQRFSVLSAMLVYQLMGYTHRDPSQRILADTYHSSLVSMLRQLDLIKKASQIAPRPSNNLDELESRWKSWSYIETQKRCVWTIVLCDLLTATRSHSQPLLSLSEISVLRLPCPDACWSAQDATQWSLYDSVFGREAPTLPFVLTLLLRDELVNNLDGKIGMLNTLSASIIGRTLAFLAQAVRSIEDGPSRSLLDNNTLTDLGLGGVDAGEKVRRAQDRLESLDCFERLEVTRELLKSLRRGSELWLCPKFSEEVVDEILR